MNRPESSFTSLENRAEEFGALGFDGLHAFSNDLFDNDTIKEVGGGNPNDLLLCVGGPGYALSLGVQRQETSIINVDTNPAVATMANLVLQSIAANPASEGAVNAIRSRFDGLYDLERHILAGYGQYHLNEDFSNEIDLFGSMHWSRPENYGQVRERVRTDSITVVSADITNPTFLAELRKVSKASRRRCGLLSLTNVHMYLPWQTLSNTLYKLPVIPGIQIVYSNAQPTIGLKADTVRGIGAYNQVVEDKVSYYLH
jgi:hypothetical protein